MCRKIRCDGESCKVLGFWVYLNKALVCVITFGFSRVTSSCLFFVYFFFPDARWSVPARVPVLPDKRPSSVATWPSFIREQMQIDWRGVAACARPLLISLVMFDPILCTDEQLSMSRDCGVVQRPSRFASMPRRRTCQPPIAAWHLDIN